MSHEHPSAPPRFGKPLLALVLSTQACQWLGGIEVLPSTIQMTCPDATDVRGGPELVEIHSEAGNCFYIDQTEVTQAQYQEFLDSGPRPTSDALCDWNTDFTPGCTLSSPLEQGAELPVSCVDHCDAAAFCAWAGKSLCHDHREASTDPESSNWYLACAGREERAFPYGNAEDPRICNGVDNPDTGCGHGHTDCALVEENALTGCSSPLGVSHLIGNVEEWTAACTGNVGLGDRCMVRGGSAEGPPLTCQPFGERARDYRYKFTGFRCCLENHDHER